MAKLLYFGERAKSNVSEREIPTAERQTSDQQIPDQQAPDQQAPIRQSKCLTSARKAEISKRDYFESLYEEGRRAVDRGDLARALEICDEACDWAASYGTTADIDRASCGKYAILLYTGESELAVHNLRTILMRSTEPTNQYLASYHISFHYELREDFAKSRFYADLALDHAKRTQSDIHLAVGYSHLGNLLIRESHFPEALENYQQAWTLFADKEIYKRMAILTSMGFCHLACGRFSKGFENLFTVRKNYIQMKLGSTIATGRLRLAFCFGYLEIEKFHQAIRHGEEALRIGEECGDRDVVKKAFYLLGEAQKLAGNEMKAFTYFAGLQEEFYPDNPTLPELLLYTDTNKLVNVWA